MHIRSRLLVMMGGVFFALRLSAGTVLSFDVASHTVPFEGTQSAKAAPQDSNHVLTADLSGDLLRIDEPDAITQYDFKKSRMLRLDKSKKTYDEGSLYVVLGFNVAEFANRMVLGKALAAGKVGFNPMMPSLTENLMSLADPANATVIERDKRGGETVYRSHQAPLMTISSQVEAVPEAILSQYVRFLRYSVGGHPQILAELAHGRGIPVRLSIVRTNNNTETRTLTLRSVATVDEGPLSLEGYTREPTEREPFITLRRLSASPATDLQSRLEVLRQERDAALNAGQPLDALLANMAAMLSSGDQAEATAWLSAHRDPITANADAQRLFKSLNPTDADSAKQAVQTLEAMMPGAGSHAYVLAVFEANIQNGLHQAPKALSLFMSALHADPTITGAWIDAGNLYYGGFGADAAWACWDAARELRPGHFMLKTVDERERKLRADHPEFF